MYRFEHMFADNELHLATLTDPFFKLSWLDNEDEIRRAKNLLKGEYVRFQWISNETKSYAIISVAYLKFWRK